MNQKKPLAIIPIEPIKPGKYDLFIIYLFRRSKTATQRGWWDWDWFQY